jgi:phospholipid N-methyltransferase
MSRSAFFKEFIRGSKQTGSVHPSSKALSKRMISRVNFDKAECIIELGAGDGCITREIIKKLKPHTILLVFELNDLFVEKFLQFNLPNVHVICDSAAKMGEYLKKFGVEKADYIISALPLTNFPPELKESIIAESVHSLKPGGIYMQFQYLTTVKKLLRTHFKRVTIGFVPVNIPPAFVYTCYN